jgi:hypothetical protein
MTPERMTGDSFVLGFRHDLMQSRQKAWLHCSRRPYIDGSSSKHITQGSGAGGRMTTATVEGARALRGLATGDGGEAAADLEEEEALWTGAEGVTAVDVLPSWDDDAVAADELALAAAISCLNQQVSPRAQ